MSRASWIFIFSVLFILIGALHAGEGWLSFFSILIVDGGLATLWIGSAVLLGMAILRLLPLQIPLPLRFATAGGLGLGIFSLASLGAGLAGFLGRNTALALPILGVAAFVATHLPLMRQFSFLRVIQRSEN